MEQGKKAQMNVISMFVLAVLAGSFIAFGAVFSTTLVAGAGEFLSYGTTRLLAGLGFSMGLILVVIGGAELFTGNNLIVMAWASRMVTTRLMLKNWVIVYFGNLVGALGTVVLMFASGQYRFGGGAVGAAALYSAHTKMGYGFVQAIALGILCNALVCLAVWMTYSGRTVIDKVVAISVPVTAFVACGFEHCIANMYYLPLALAIREGAPAEFWTAIGKTAADYSALSVEGFLVYNLLPVTIGNIIGGALAVAGVYWFVYLRERAAATSM
ncbi:MAG TPA: formate/nitrite transporter family protein [Xanthomonadales bacterium]|nr:formate/nitrite transporter family protein [Xanthomonadales bacterium]